MASERTEPKLKISPTLLCVKLSDTVMFGEELCEYLRNALDKCEFKVQKSEIIFTKEQKNTEIMLSFPCKVTATKASNLLKSSDTGLSLSCYFPEHGHGGSVSFETQGKQWLIEYHRVMIHNEVTKILSLHAEKMNEIKSVVKKLDTIVKGGKLPITENEPSIAEMKATTDKLEELSLQENEFRSNTEELYEKLEKINPSVDFEPALNSFLKEFHRERNRLKSALPVYSRRSDITNEVKKHQVCVILGETGSGKSTQIVQYLYQAGFATNGLIVCTQPRKIAAMTLASYAAKEMFTNVGQTVGYDIGKNVKRTNVTRVLYMTNYILLNKCLKDNKLKKFSCIIIDEAHERNVFIDLLLGVLKSALDERPDLRIIITSATINPDVYVSYFGGSEKCHVIRVSGNNFPVEVHWTKTEDGNPFDDYMNQAVRKSIKLHRENPTSAGDILVFLATPLEAEICCAKFTEQCPGNDFRCLPLHGKLHSEEQAKVFVNDPCKRKIVFATNYAETSLTIPGIRFVVDTGLVKEMHFNPTQNISSLQICQVSKSSAEQRKGRAGRTSSGQCYRLYSKSIYLSMEECSKPEIKRIHLGQALLKLMEFGIDPLCFEFLESPSKDTLTSAMEYLCDIGVVAGGKITDIGRWISKLPLDPRQGVLVKLGIQEGIPMEAIVVASFGEGDFFVRSGTEREKDQADIKKLQFCHNGGDLLTKLNVYRGWRNVKEKLKKKWCLEHYIHAKSMDRVRETVNELRFLLREDLKEDIPDVMTHIHEADQILNKLLVRIFRHNISFFLGHERAGYFCIRNRHIVQVHPSSVLYPLNHQPETIVYQQILETSRQFITNITPVHKSHISELSPEVLTSYRQTVDNIRVSLVKTFHVGKTVLWEFTGPLHKYRKDKERILNDESSNRNVIVDINQNMGDIHLFCSRVDEHLCQRLEEELLRIKNTLQQERVEWKVGKLEGVRVDVGAGLNIMEVLMPHRYRTIVVTQTRTSKVEICDIEDSFSAFGEIVEIEPLVKRNNEDETIWGYVTFKTCAEASNAVAGFTSPDIVVYPGHQEIISSAVTNFKVKIDWWQRPAEGVAHVVMGCTKDCEIALRKRRLLIDDQLIIIESTATENQLLLRGLPPTTLSGEIIDSFARLLSIPNAQINSRIQTVVAETSEGIYETVYNAIEQEALKYSARASFDLSFSPDPRKNSSNLRYTAFLNFKNPDEGKAAFNDMINNQFNVGLSNLVRPLPTKVTAEIETSVPVGKRVFDAIRDDLESELQSVKSNHPNVRLKVNQSKAGNMFVKITAVEDIELARAKVLVHNIIQGDTIECGADRELLRLFTRDGRCEIRNIEKEVGSVLSVDNRTKTINIKGSRGKRKRSFSRIQQYLDEMAGLVETVISLKGDGKPRGLMKQIVMEYGSDLDHLKQIAEVKSVTLDYTHHQITILGTEMSVATIKNLIQEISDCTQNDFCEISNMPDCSICLCPVAEHELYRIECCGHPCCTGCIKQQISSAIRNRTFPITCAAEKCEQLLVIEDLNNLIRQGCATQQELMTSAINCFIGKHPDEYRYCVTPDCEMIYEVSCAGTPFTCSECHQTMCTACHVPYHIGLSCPRYRSTKKEENKIDVWLKKDPKKRKLCPNCSVAIEKSEGCNHIKCKMCWIHICWVCLDKFKSESECYGHLEGVHGSFV